MCHTAGAGVAVTVAVAAAVIVARPTPPPQWTGTQLEAALLPLSDLPAGYRVLHPDASSGSSLGTDPDTYHPPTKANCQSGRSVVTESGTDGFSVSLGYGSTALTESYFIAASADGTSYTSVSKGIAQFSSPAKAGAYLSAAHTCLTDEELLSSPVETAAVDGDQAVTATFQVPTSSALLIEKFLLVLHGTDVFILSVISSNSNQNLSQITIPRAAELIAELIARVDALTPTPSASPSQ